MENALQAHLNGEQIDALEGVLGLGGGDQTVGTLGTSQGRGTISLSLETHSRHVLVMGKGGANFEGAVQGVAVAAGGDVLVVQ